MKTKATLAFKFALRRAKCVARFCVERAVRILMAAKVRYFDACVLAASFAAVA